ncbi:MAG: MFS transporter [Fimbriimonadales bacterium]|nr:MFS transporter [Fimbriimonadales bacterium]
MQQSCFGDCAWQHALWSAQHAPPCGVHEQNTSHAAPTGRTLSHAPSRTIHKRAAILTGLYPILPIFNHFVPIFLREMGLSATLITFVLTWDNYLNMLMQPIVGQLSDNTRTALGRRKPWVLAGAPLAGVAFLMVPASPVVWGMMLAIFLTNFGAALMRSPGVALIGDLYPSRQRSLTNGIINLMLGVGAGLAYFGGGWLYGQFGRYAPFLFGSAMLFLAIGVMLLFIQEPATPAGQPEESEAGFRETLRTLFSQRDSSLFWMLAAILSWFMGFTALEALLSLIGKEALGIPPDKMGQFVALLPAVFVLCAVPSGILATRFGRRRIILLGLTGLIATLLYGYTVQSAPMLMGFLVLAGFFWAFVNVNSLPALYDTAPFLRAGIITGLYYLASNLSAVLGPQLAGVLIDLTDENYRVVFLYGAFFMALAWGCMSRVRVA